MGKKYYKKQKIYRSKIFVGISVSLIIIGITIFLYPGISNYFAKKNQTNVIRIYQELIQEKDENELSKELDKAKVYNENLAGEPVHDPFVVGSGYALPDNYKETLNITKDGVMGYIEIPKISVYLPIYHGTSEEVLEQGVGHIETTSLPIGGISTHSVLTGHTGLLSAELFTRLDEMKIGDIFYIHILNELLTYKVYETKVILPEEIDELQITNDKDWVTLVTCTPYGINTHRLLVKAERTEYEEYKSSNESNNSQNLEAKSKNYYLIGIEIGVAIIFTFLIFALICLLYKKTKDRKSKKE